MSAFVPSSRGSISFRLSIVDVLFAAVSPLLALYFRSAYILTAEGVPLVIAYCGISFVSALLFFLIFRVHEGIAQYFSVHDALVVVKAVVWSELLTCVVLFTFTRLEGIPRSTPVIHGLILIAAMISARMLTRLSEPTTIEQGNANESDGEHIIIVGASRLAALYVKFLTAYSPHRRRVVAILDSDPAMLGRSISGVRVLGGPQDLLQIVDEFAVHGVRTDGVILGGNADMVSVDVFNELEANCLQREITLECLPDILGLNESQPRHKRARATDTRQIKARLMATPYHHTKRVFDVSISLLLLIVLFPALILACVLALLDVGLPILFWQRRQGQGGRGFLLYKIRTLRPPFDLRGKRVPNEKRLSFIGRSLRMSGADELPQLLNVLVGDMSLVGPRPLLPADQPADPSVRLAVKPGITGWAQINGAKLLGAEEKQDLDGWYVRNASFWLDLRILVQTIGVVFKGALTTEELLREGTAESGQPKVAEVAEIAERRRAKRTSYFRASSR